MESKPQSNASSSLAAPAVMREAREAEARGGDWRKNESVLIFRPAATRTAGRLDGNRRAVLVISTRTNGGGCDRRQIHEGEGWRRQM